MKIGNPADKHVQTAHTASTSATGAGATAQSTSASAIPAQAAASANVALSSTASTLLSSGSTPEFDAEKVARMSQSIQDGTFKVNHGAIADKLIANAQEVLGKVQS